MTRPVFYSFRRCPYAMRARLALDVSDLNYEHREILLRDKPKEMLEASPKGTVPVLVIDDHTVLEESIDIMHYALNQNDPENWLTADKEITADLISINDGLFKQNLDRYKYPTRYPDEDCSNAFKNCLSILEKYEKRLNTSRYLAGDQLSLADMALAPFIRQFSKVEPEKFEQLPYSKLKTWLNLILNGDRFTRIMKKHDLWKQN